MPSFLRFRLAGEIPGDHIECPDHPLPPEDARVEHPVCGLGVPSHGQFDGSHGMGEAVLRVGPIDFRGGPANLGLQARVVLGVVEHLQGGVDDL